MDQTRGISQQPYVIPPCLAYLGLHLHGEVLEHVMEVFNAPLQLQDLVVPRLDLVKSLFCCFGVNQDLNTTEDIPFL